MSLLAVLTCAVCSPAEEVHPHPDFSITADVLEKMTADLPGEISEAIMSNPAGFLERIKDILDEPKELFLLADKQHSLGESYVPGDLVDLETYDLRVGRAGLNLRSIAMPDSLAMAAAAVNEGITLVFSSAYRSYGYQKTVYERNVRELGQTQADRESAKPGTSQHQLGTTVDFGSITDEFAQTPAGKWLFANAWEYGFSLSYPEGYESVTGYRHEIWHYRFISRPAARLEHEFFESIQYYLLFFFSEHLETLRSGLQSDGGPSA